MLIDEENTIMTDDELDGLLTNSAIVRNRRKIYATRANAQAFIKVQEEFGSFDRYLWEWVDFTPLVNEVEDYATFPASTPLSERLSKDLKKRGFKFVGPVCVYSYLQAAGLVNDHEIDCDFR